jgi:hypothetical protein
MRSKFALPLPHFVLHPLTALTIAAVHVYLAYGHLGKVVAGDVEWCTSGKASVHCSAHTCLPR